MCSRLNGLPVFRMLLCTQLPSISLQMGRNLTIQILNVLEFSSDRKRMSIVAKMPDGKIKIMVKGAVSK